jgi:hypothetical protein
MSAPHDSESFLDRYWPVFVILLGIAFALILGRWKPHA